MYCAEWYDACFRSHDNTYVLHCKHFYGFVYGMLSSFGYFVIPCCRYLCRNMQVSKKMIWRVILESLFNEYDVNMLYYYITRDDTLVLLRVERYVVQLINGCGYLSLLWNYLKIFLLNYTSDFITFGWCMMMTAIIKIILKEYIKQY